MGFQNLSVNSTLSGSSSPLFPSTFKFTSPIDLDGELRLSSSLSAPFYHTSNPSIIPSIPDTYTSLVLPIIVYWALSLFYLTIDHLKLPFTERYRLHESDEVTSRNTVSPFKVAYMVLLQQLIQTILGLFVLQEDTQTALTLSSHLEAVQKINLNLATGLVRLLDLQTVKTLLRDGQVANWIYWWGIPSIQFLWAFFIMDAWQYALHRSFHQSRFLYRNFHSHHHRLYVPYAFGALYNHPVEGLLLDSAGGAISHAASFMTIRQGILLFTFATFKTVSDHGGYAFPIYLDPLGLFFPNTAEYHDVHHQSSGLKWNFSQPFFIHFDVLFGTRMKVEEFNRLKESKEKKRREREEKKEKVIQGEKEEGKSEGATTKTATTNSSASSALQNRTSEKEVSKRRNQTDHPATNWEDQDPTDPKRRELDGIDFMKAQKSL